MRAQKLRRGWIIATVSTSIAALSHALAGGDYPPFILWAFCTSLAALVCVGLAGIKMPRLALGASVTFAQGIFHLLYNLAGGVVLTGSTHLSHEHHVLVGNAVSSHHHHVESPLMLLLHGLAALATYVLVRQADVVIAALKALASNPWRRIFRLRELPALPQAVKVFASQFQVLVYRNYLRARGFLRGPPDSCELILIFTPQLRKIY